VTAVSNRPQSFPLSVTLKCCKLQLGQKQRAPTISPACLPGTPHVNPPSAMSLSSRLASAGNGALLTLLQMHWPPQRGGPSHVMFCFCFFLNLRSITAKQKRVDSWFATLAHAHLGRFPHIWTGDKLQSQRTVYSNPLITSRVVLRAKCSANQGHWNLQVKGPVIKWIILMNKPVQEFNVSSETRGAKQSTFLLSKF